MRKKCCHIEYNMVLLQLELGLFLMNVATKLKNQVSVAPIQIVSHFYFCFFFLSPHFDSIDIKVDYNFPIYSHEKKG